MFARLEEHSTRGSVQRGREPVVFEPGQRNDYSTADTKSNFSQTENCQNQERVFGELRGDFRIRAGQNCVLGFESSRLSLIKTS